MNNIDNIRALILASILTANEFGEIDLSIVMSTGIDKEWFEDEAQKVMFEVMKVCHDGGIAFDDSVIMEYMRKAGIQEPQNLILHIMSQKELPQSVLLGHISFLKEAYQIKMLHLLKDEMGKMLQGDSINADAVSQMVQNSLNNYATLTSGSATRRLSEVRKLRKAKPPAQRLVTGIAFIDSVLTDRHKKKGIRNEGLIFISGKKQSGKTFILTRLIENISKDNAVMFGSMEFGEDLYDENIEQQQEDGFFNGNIENIHTFDSIYDVDGIIAEIRLQHKLYGIKLVALDSMMRMTNNNPDLKTDERRISEMFSKLGKLSKELKIPIIVVVQSSKEDLKSSVISVKGSMNADHEAYVWFHLAKTHPKDPSNELRNVIWVKNKDTHKHPIQTLMFVPQTSDFYRVELDENGNVEKALDKFRIPPPKVLETTYEEIPKDKTEIGMNTGEQPLF